MTKKRNWLIVIIPCVCLLVVPTASSETMFYDVFKGEPSLDERYGGVDDSWARSNIEEILNIYGSTSAGNTSSKATNNLPYEEMGVYGVEYENIFIDRYSKEPDFMLPNTEKKEGKLGSDKTLNEQF